MLKKISDAWYWVCDDPIRWLIFLAILAIGASALVGALISWVAIAILWGAAIVCTVLGFVLNYFFPFIDPVKLMILLAPVLSVVILYFVF